MTTLTQPSLLEKYAASVQPQASRDQETWVVQREVLADLARELRDDPETRFDLLLDVCGVDFPDREDADGGRFEAVYHLYSIPRGERLRLNQAARVPSVEIVPHRSEHSVRLRHIREHRVGTEVSAEVDRARRLEERHPVRRDGDLGVRAVVVGKREADRNRRPAAVVGRTRDGNEVDRRGSGERRIRHSHRGSSDVLGRGRHGEGDRQQCQ